MTAKCLKQFVIACLIQAVLLSTVVNAEGRQQWPVVSIIIDDIGYHEQIDREMVDLPGDLTFAILPGGPQAKKLATYAHLQGKEVMLHMPMQSTLGLAAEIGVLNIDMEKAGVVNALQQAFAKVPHAIGMNNHQGSLLTRHPGHMAWVMTELLSKGSFFVDSRTSKKSVAEQVANEVGVPVIRRDVFLDHDINEASIHQQFNRLLSLAKKNGHAVAIGHPHPETLAVLRQMLPQLAAENIKVVPISSQIKAPQAWLSTQAATLKLDD